MNRDVDGEPDEGPAAGVFVMPRASEKATTPQIVDARVGAGVAEILRIAIPAVVTMLSYTAMQFVDLLIVSRLGPGALAAVGNGGVAAFVPAAAMFGMVGVVATYVSQHLGAGTPEEGSGYAWNGLWLSLVVWVVVLLPLTMVLPEGFVAMRSLMGLESDPDVVQMESVYGRILLGGMLLPIVARELSHFFYGVHRARVVMVAALVGNFLNVPVSYALVLGRWGAPEMGVAGAAWGTLVGSAIEAGILFATFVGPAFNRDFATRRAWRLDGAKLRDIARLGWPPAVMFGNELICWWVFMAGLIAHFGVAHNAAGWIVLRYMHVSFMPAVGLSMAVTAVVGKAMGMRRVDLAAQRTWIGLAMAVGFMGACAVLFVVLRVPLVDVFASRDPQADPRMVEEIVRVGAVVLILAAGFQVFDATAITLIGALRGAGDTVWPGVAGAVLSWLCIIGLGKVLMEAAPSLGSIGPWIGASAYIIVLAVALGWRFLGGRWKRIDLLSDASRRARSRLAGDAGEGVVPDLPMADVPDLDGARAGDV